MTDETTGLARFVEAHAPLFVITGAGCSTDSGIADYRDRGGAWKRPQPVQLKDFMTSLSARRRYWARSMTGWPAFAAARPNYVHHALRALEQAGHLAGVVTQNVDGLHGRAGQRNVIELHGNLSRVICLDCGGSRPRAALQRWLIEHNPDFAGRPAKRAPDGDADVEFATLETFAVPVCKHCGGALKPDVVFYGESVPKPRVARAFELLAASGGLLTLGSSLMVFSSFRFCRHAAQTDLKMAVINRGATRADDLATLKLDEALAPALTRLCRDLGVAVADGAGGSLAQDRRML